jgi:hypothetical protein
MMSHFPFATEQKSRLLSAALALLLAVNPAAVLSQSLPDGPPPGVAGGPPPGAPPLGAPQGPPPGAPAGRGGGGLPPMMMGPVLTPAQKIVAALPPPGPGGMPPRPPLPADAPMPSADPRDLQGTWHHNQPLQFRMQNDMYGVPAPYTMEGAKVLSRRVQSLKDGKPFINASAICRPPGPQWQRDLNFPFQILQTKDGIEFIFEEYHSRWYVSLDPQRLPLPAQKQYMGKSVGHWDGNTLVVETNDFKDAIWLDVDGTPLSAKGMLIVVEK